MQQDVRVDIRDLLRFLRQGLIPAILVGGVAVYLALQLANRQDPTYEAQATVLAAQTNQVFREFGLSSVTAPPLDVEAYRAAGTSGPVLQDALERMGVSNPSLDDVRRLSGRVTVRADATSSASLIHIIGEGTTPESATNRANAVANALVDWDRARAADSLDDLIERLELEIASLTGEIRSLQTLNDASVTDQINGLVNLRAERNQDLSYARALSASATPLLSIMQPATPPVAPVAPRPVLNAIIALFLAVVLTYGVLLLRRAMDNRLTGVEDLARVSGYPVLAEFPRIGWGDKAALREASSYLRTNLLFATSDVHPKVLTITSAQQGEGKTSTATSLAEGFVRNGYRTLLVDADMRAPSIAKLYRIPNGRNRASLTEWLREPYDGHQPVDVTLGPNQSLQVIPVFQPVPQPAELLSIGFRSCLEKWRQEYDVIVIDTAPILAVADALTIAPLSSGTLLVTHMNKTDRNQVTTAIDLLKRVGVRVLGIAATHVQGEHGRGQLYGYGYGPLNDSSGPPDGPNSGGPGRKSSAGVVTAGRTRTARRARHSGKPSSG